MAVTAAKMSLVIIHTVDAFKMLACLTCCTYHDNIAKNIAEFEFFLKNCAPMPTQLQNNALEQLNKN